MARDSGSQATALTYVGPGSAALRPITLPPLADGMVEVETRFSALSRGTERLVFDGAVPTSEFDRMRAPFQVGDFPFPVVYGYAAVGVVRAGPASLDGRAVFALSPHQTVARLPVEAVTPLPDGLPPRRATLAANTETALNVVWDAGIGPGDKVAIVGAGILGLLIAGIASAVPGTTVTALDPNPGRAEAAAAMGAAFAQPEDAPGDQDCVIHTSATEAGLETALRVAGFEAKVIEASWFGSTAPRVRLGEAFHSRRLNLVSSQVGQVPAHRRARWSRSRRMAMALKLLCDTKFDRIITEEADFKALPDRIAQLLDRDSPGIATVIRYD